MDFRENARSPSYEQRMMLDEPFNYPENDFQRRKYVNSDVIFADGSTMTGLFRNVDVLYYDVPANISEEILGSRLDKVTIVDHYLMPDGTRSDESMEKNYCRLIGPKEGTETDPHPYWIAFSERTRQEMMEQTMFATIEYVAMMADIEI